MTDVITPQHRVHQKVGQVNYESHWTRNIRVCTLALKDHQKHTPSCLECLGKQVRWVNGVAWQVMDPVPFARHFSVNCIPSLGWPHGCIQDRPARTTTHPISEARGRLQFDAKTLRPKIDFFVVKTPPTESRRGAFHKLDLGDFVLLQQD